MKVYYGRMVEARRLAQLGISAPEIARRLNTTLQTVHGWIKMRAHPLGGGSSRNQRKIP
jgi:DNA-binding transcriptional regulator YiaG